MRKMYIDDLPRKEGIGALKGKQVIDWIKSIGNKVKFIYGDVNDEVFIINYTSNNQILTIQYKNKDFNISTSNFTMAKLGVMLGKLTNDFKFKIGDVINDLEIIDRAYKTDKQGKSWKYYKYKCNKCGFDGNTPHYNKNGEYQKEHWITEGNLIKGHGGVCCKGKITIESTSIFSKDRWMISLGVDKEESKKYTSQSNKKIKTKCPYCKNIDYKTCYNIYKHKSISCKCGDGYSYISKYVYSLLKQLELNFDTEVKYEWNKYINPLNNKITQASIDFVVYYNSREIPIESDGGFHRQDNKMSGQTKEQSEYIDKQRDDNCLKYLGEETIRISDEGDVRENILNSKLGVLFDLIDIDWLRCEEYALCNLVKEVCDYWNNKKEWETTVDLAKIFNINRSHIIKYLKQGVNLSWCGYNPKEEMRKCACRTNKLKSRRVEMYKNDIFLGVFESCSELDRQSELLFATKLDYKSISDVARGRRRTHRGYTFKYVEDTQEVV